MLKLLKDLEVDSDAHTGEKRKSFSLILVTEISLGNGSKNLTNRKKIQCVDLLVSGCVSCFL